jgi:Zn-dependent protease
VTRAPVPHLELLSLILLQPSLPPVAVGLIIALLVISLGIHEAAHGWVALQCGDTTARDLGRITLNPIPHIDPFMTILLPLVMYFSTGFVFGGARPVPVNYYNLRRPLRDMALVAIAGPGSNFLLAALFFLLRKVLVTELGIWEPGRLGDIVLQYAVAFNLLLAAFNLLPIPPLDGSRVMTWLLPGGMRDAYARLERFGIYIVLLLVFLVPGVRQLLGRTMELMESAIRAIVTLGGVW